MAIRWRTPDSRGQICPISSARAASPAPSASRYPARSAWVIRGQGPSSNAWRAAPTALAMSASWASATLKKNSSVPESITSMVASELGATHSPPM